MEESILSSGYFSFSIYCIVFFLSFFSLFSALSKSATQCNNSHWCGLHLASTKVQVQHILFNSLWLTFYSFLNSSWFTLHPICGSKACTRQTFNTSYMHSGNLCGPEFNTHVHACKSTFALISAHPTHPTNLWFRFQATNAQNRKCD